jgi:hypothetical protein
MADGCERRRELSRSRALISLVRLTLRIRLCITLLKATRLVICHQLRPSVRGCSAVCVCFRGYCADEV